jgi:lipopolysaccharide/colanic/teichoic acid biosynthesis glycosyltransferase
VRCGFGERLIAALALAALSPLFLAVTAAVLLFDGPPVFFRQERFGRGGAPFNVFKFRTMLRNSEALQGRLQDRLGEKDRLFKLSRDPRVTRTGAFLRRTFLDELPQLLNVIRGEMRLIGPRPLPASDQSHYTQPAHAFRLKGMPGMTGLWQVSGRNERTFDEMCLLDAYYLCNRSRALDARILARTARLLARHAGLRGES